MAEPIHVAIVKVTPEHTRLLAADPNGQPFHIRYGKYFYDRRCDKCRGPVQIYHVPDEEWSSLGLAGDKMLCLRCLQKHAHADYLAVIDMTLKQDF